MFLSTKRRPLSSERVSRHLFEGRHATLRDRGPVTVVATLLLCLVLVTTGPLRPAMVAAQAPQGPAQTGRTFSPSSSGSPALVFPLRSIALAGNWGTNRVVVKEWHEGDTTLPVIPADYLAWLDRLRVNWVCIVVEMTYDDSMDSTVERNAGYVSPSESERSSFSDAALRQMIRELRRQGIDVYLTLAFSAPEAETAARPVRRWQLGDSGAPDGGPCCNSGIRPEFWPWRPDHPDHERFVAEFWETYTQHAVHVATLAEEEGVRMYSLGTETDRLFRTRPGGYFVNDFGDELRAMVGRVRAVYSGLLTYDMHYSVLLDPDFYGPGLHHLWNDLDLDVVGVSAWFPLTEAPPSTVMSVEAAQAEYERLFREHLLPLAGRNPERPIVFLEYGAMDLVETPATPDDPMGFPPFVFTDKDGNGIDDGRETQANVHRGLLNAMRRYPGVVNGAFFWDNWMASDEHWAGHWARRRQYALRGKLSEEVVRAAYARTARNRPPQAVGVIPAQAPRVGSAPLVVEVSPYFQDPENDPLTWVARSSAPGIVRAAVTDAVLEITAESVGRTTVSVTATDGGGWATQAVRVDALAMAPPFTDDPIEAGVTPLKAVHFMELRARIAALRARAGLPVLRWTDPVLTGGVTPVRAVHLRELRDALADVYEAAERPRPIYTDGRVTVGVTVIRAVHVTELRRAVRELE